MKKDEVPQDGARAYMGMRKVVYAVDEAGRMTVARSSGWEAEEIVLDQAMAEYEIAAAAAHARVLAGQSSPLEYHMFRQRMDVVLLAQSTGFFRWTVRRHLRPGPFASMSRARKERYADALGLSVAELERLPDAP